MTIATQVMKIMIGRPILTTTTAMMETTVSGRVNTTGRVVRNDVPVVLHVHQRAHRVPNVRVPLATVATHPRAKDWSRWFLHRSTDAQAIVGFLLQVRPRHQEAHRENAALGPTADGNRLSRMEVPWVSDAEVLRLGRQVVVPVEVIVTCRAIIADPPEVPQENDDVVHQESGDVVRQENGDRVHEEEAAVTATSRAVIADRPVVHREKDDRVRDEEAMVMVVARVAMIGPLEVHLPNDERTVEDDDDPRSMDGNRQWQRKSRRHTERSSTHSTGVEMEREMMCWHRCLEWGGGAFILNLRLNSVVSCLCSFQAQKMTSL